MELIQTLFVFLLGALSLGFLLRKFVLKKKSAKASGCSSDCGCH